MKFHVASSTLHSGQLKCLSVQQQGALNAQYPSCDSNWSCPPGYKRVSGLPAHYWPQRRPAPSAWSFLARELVRLQLSNSLTSISLTP